MRGNVTHKKSRSDRDFVSEIGFNGKWQDKDAGSINRFVSHDDVISFGRQIGRTSNQSFVYCFGNGFCLGMNLQFPVDILYMRPDGIDADGKIRGNQFIAASF
jgi:hypothetical protein